MSKRFLNGLAIAALIISVPLAQAETRILDSVVAIVEDDVIMSSELRARLEMVEESIKASGQEAPEREVLVRETLDRLVLESIQLQMGQRAGVRISDAQLNGALNNIAAQNRMTLEQFSQQLETEGKSYLQLREDVRRELILQRVQAGNVNQRIQITEEEAKNFLASEEGQALSQEQYHLIHALLPLPEGEQAIAEARAHVQQLYQRIQAGEEFQAVIGSSGGRYTFTGGDLGWRPRGDLPSLFADIAPALALGETAAPVESPAGFHLIYLAEKRGGSTIVPQTHVRHILIKPSAIRDEEESLKFITKLRQQIIDGADFTEVARENSEDIGSAQEGGDLSWANPGQMVPEFEAAMATAEIGEITEPIKSQFGWHILEVLERREQDMTDVVVKNRAREVLHQRKYQDELQAWLRKIRDEAFVDVK
jgi:peptidyl-prolyl cis-trans isomerase SurA